MSVRFDFDRWMYLAREEPKRFEELRRQLIEEKINASHPASRRRLRGLQFQIDARRRLSGSSMGACIALSTMMLEHLYNELLPAMNALINDDFDALRPTPVKNDNVVLYFPRQ